MIWVFLSLLAAWALATADAVTKRYFSGLGVYGMGLVRLVYAVPWLVIVLCFIPWTRPDLTFFGCVLLALPLEILAFFSYMRAIRVSPLSLTLPFLAFTPAFMVLTGWLVLGESLSLAGMAGIGLIVVGGYGLNFARVRSGWLGPLRAVAHEPGSRLMLGVSFLYSLTAAIGKLGIQHSNPQMFGGVYFLALTVAVIVLLPVVPGASVRHLRWNPLAGVMLGGLMGLMIFAHMMAISLTQAAYMIALKRTSLLWGVFYGVWWFREERPQEKLIGAGIMLCGVLIIAWGG